MLFVLLLGVAMVSSQINFDFTIPRRSYHVTTKPLALSVAAVEIEGSGLPEYTYTTALPNAVIYTTTQSTPGDMAAFFTSFKYTTPKRFYTTDRSYTTEDWKRKLVSLGQYSKELRQRRNMFSTSASTSTSTTTTTEFTTTEDLKFDWAESESAGSLNESSKSYELHSTCVPSELFADGCIPLWIMFTTASLASG